MEVKLNQPQEEAVMHVDGPLLILAGAGSGKTRVITHRVAKLIERGIEPYHILAITFTNKAAGELKQRVNDLIGGGGDKVWVSTFHSMCVRILRTHIHRLGYDTNFTIYDTDDQKRLIREVCKVLQLDPKLYPERRLLAEISSAKEQFISVSQYQQESLGDYRKSKFAEVYALYQQRLRKNNGVDFDDLLYLTVELFQDFPEVLEQYQERFRYIMVDEYQDTNGIQFLLVRQLARKYRNLCVVGDDDQSIYKFRGADVRNILDFQQEYPEAKVIKLEQNYRSVGNILAAANGVIKNNSHRTDKALWTQKDAGRLIPYKQYETEYQEAEEIAANILRSCESGEIRYRDCAILYRTNAQSRVLEEKLLMRNIPYHIYGGTNFYSRMEVKDLLAYLRIVDNDNDDVSAKRIINVPKRGIGASTITKIEQYAQMQDISFMQAMYQAEDIPGLGKSVGKITSFVDMVINLRRQLREGMPLHVLYKEMLYVTEYTEALRREDTQEAMARIENIEELGSKIVQYQEEAEEPTLAGLLENIALVADVDQVDQSQNCVSLMTIHSAKGLEFPYVYLCGLEEGLFPSSMAKNSDDQDAMDEERRLCYVGITRAEERLFLSSAKCRVINGSSNYLPISRFVKEIPQELLDLGGYRKIVTPTPRKKEETANAKIFKSRPVTYTTMANMKPIGELEYQEGDTVRHIKFGEGKVLSIEDGERDKEVTVEFDNYGIKRMLATFAKLKKV